MFCPNCGKDVDTTHEHQHKLTHTHYGGKTYVT